MTDDASSERSDPESELPGHLRALASLRHELEEVADAGTLAALRRMAPDAPPPAFFRLTSRALDDLLHRAGARREQLETRWATVVQAMALAVGRKGSFSLLAGPSLGAAVAKAQVAEMRVLRLLNAREEQMSDIVRGIVHQLVSHGQPFNVRQLAELVLFDDERHETARRAIARDFYRHQDS